MPMCLVTLLFLAILTLPVLPQDGYREYGHITNEVLLREKPDSSLTGPASLSRGQWVGILDRDKGWAHIVPLELYALSDSVDADFLIGPTGAELRVEPDPSAAVLGKVPAGTQLRGYPGKLFSLVAAPPTLSFWVPEQDITVDGMPIRDQDLVGPEELSISPQDYKQIAELEGLRLVLLPTGLEGPAELLGADSGRFGPSYGVKYPIGDEWFQISCGTDGLGGPDFGEFLYTVQTDVLGELIVGTMNYGNSNATLVSGAAIRDGSTAEGKPYRLTPVFTCSPGLEESVVRRILESLRVVKLQ